MDKESEKLVLIFLFEPRNQLSFADFLHIYYSLLDQKCLDLYFHRQIIFRKELVSFLVPQTEKLKEV